MLSKNVGACFTACVLVICVATGISQEKPKDKPDAPVVLWEQPVDISTRDVYYGPGGRAMVPDLKNAAMMGRQPGGNNLKYRIRDRHGNEWVAKIADESQPETAAVRLLWAVGYKTEINYLMPDLQLGAERPFSNVRLEARPKGVKRGERWMWADNPFIGTKEFDGLKIMMAMLNNWDLKDENNIILLVDGRQQYVVSDLGASFGRLAKSPQSRSGRSVGDAEDYAKSVFINGTRDGILDIEYNGMADHLIKGIKVEHGRWLADLLLQLSDKQILDAFRAANYSDEKAAAFANAFKARINALDRATKTPVAMN